MDSLNIFAHRPAALSAALGLLIVILSFLTGFAGRLIILCAIILLMLLGLLCFHRVKARTIAGMNAAHFILIFGAMTLPLILSSISLWDMKIGRLERFCGDDGTIPVEAVVINKSSAADWYSNYDIELRSVAGKGARIAGRLICKSDQALSIGDHIAFEAVFSKLDEAYADYGLDKYDLVASGMRFVCSPEGEIARLGKKDGISVRISRLRERIGAAITVYTKPDTAAMIKALLLSESDGLGIFRRDIRRCGASHLLALSGLHLAVVSAIIDRIGKRLKLSKRKRLCSQLVCAMIMLAIAGFPYSLVRATVMLLIITLSRAIGGDRDIVTVLFWTAWSIVLLDPAALVDIGFQLSFFATLGVAAAARANRRLKNIFHRFRRKHKRLRVILKPLYGVVISLGAQLFILPLLYFHFGELSLLGTVSTLLLSPLVTLIVWLSLPYTAAACLGFSLFAGAVGSMIGLCSDIMQRLASLLSRLPLYISLRYDFSIWLILLLPAALLIIRRFRKVDMLLVIILFAIWHPVYFIAVRLCEGTREFANELCFVTVNTDDAALLRSNGKCMLVDISSGGTSLVRKVDRKLPELELTEIDTYFLTHLHNAHIKSFRRLLEKRLVRRLVIPEPRTDDEAAYAMALTELAIEQEIEVISYSSLDGENIDFGAAAIKVEVPGKLSRSKHEVIGISFDIGSGKVFYAGSSRWELDEEYDFDAVVIGTHGPKLKTEPDYELERIFKVGESFRILGKASDT